jgi:hypothetical protein
MSKSLSKAPQICKKTIKSITTIRSSIMKKKLKEEMIEQQYSKNYRSN